MAKLITVCNFPLGTLLSIILERHKAKQEIETELERSVVTSENYIELTQKEELLDNKIRNL